MKIKNHRKYLQGKGDAVTILKPRWNLLKSDRMGVVINI
jgi:hypothetical protein